MRSDKLSEKQVQIYSLLVVCALVLFLAAYFYIVFYKKTERASQRTDTVVFKDLHLSIFGYEYELEQYPDRIIVHDPYLIIVRPEAQKSIIYDLNQKKKVKEVNDIVLDYAHGGLLHNENGLFTHLNDRDLKSECGLGLLRNEAEVLCTIRINPDHPENKLISISLKTLQKQDVYSSANIISAIAYIDDTLYIGEMGMTNRKSFITINKTITLPVDVPIFAIYKMNNQVYAASFKSAFNEGTESYYKITKKGDIYSVEEVERGRIVFKK